MGVAAAPRLLGVAFETPLPARRDGLLARDSSRGWKWDGGGEARGLGGKEGGLIP